MMAHELNLPENCERIRAVRREAGVADNQVHGNGVQKDLVQILKMWQVTCANLR